MTQVGDRLVVWDNIKLLNEFRTYMPRRFQIREETKPEPAVVINLSNPYKEEK